MAIEDTFHSHPKVVALFDGPCPGPAIALWVLAGSWSMDNLTDGFVPKARVKLFGLHRKSAPELVRVGLWVEVEGGFQFHEWDQRNPSGKAVKTRRKATAERVARHRQRRMGNAEASARNGPGNAPGNAACNALHPPLGNAPRNGLGNAASNPVSHGVGTVRGPQSPLPSASDVATHREGGSGPPGGVATTTAQASPRGPEPADARRSPPVLRVVRSAVELDAEADSERREMARTDEIAAVATGAYARALERRGVEFQGSARWRDAFVAVGRAAESEARRRGSDTRQVLDAWAERYVAERRSRRPDWWLERVTAWASSDQAADGPEPFQMPGESTMGELMWALIEDAADREAARLGRELTAEELDAIKGPITAERTAVQLGFALRDEVDGLKAWLAKADRVRSERESRRQARIGGGAA